jgi:hypothetical protein
MSPIETQPSGSGGTGGLVRLFDQTLGGAAANIDTGAGGIASGHGDLIIMVLARESGAVVQNVCGIQFNGDTGANYDQAWVRNNAGVIGSVSSFLATDASLFSIPGTTIAANVAGGGVFYIPSYDQTTFFKNGTGTGGYQDTVAHFVTQFITFQWRSTAAISRALLLMEDGNNLIAGSRMVIYGTK